VEKEGLCPRAVGGEREVEGKWRERKAEGDAAEQEMEWSKMDPWTPVKATAQSIMADRVG